MIEVLAVVVDGFVGKLFWKSMTIGLYLLQGVCLRENISM